MGYTLLQRQAYKTSKLGEYPFYEETNWLKNLRPTKVDIDTGLDFIYIPFKENSYCCWLFKTDADLLFFQQTLLVFLLNHTFYHFEFGFWTLDITVLLQFLMEHLQ